MILHNCAIENTRIIHFIMPLIVVMLRIIRDCHILEINKFRHKKKNTNQMIRFKSNGKPL
jgi:hypothetical protein